MSRRIMKRKKTVHNFNNGFLECYGCGDWFDFNSILPASVVFSSGVMAAFDKAHRCYKQNIAGKKLQDAAHDLDMLVKGLMQAHGWTQDDIDSGKGQSILPGQIKKFMAQSGAWSNCMHRNRVSV